MSKVKQFFKKLRPYKPYFSLMLDLGFISIRTDIWTQAFERYQFDYIRLSWRLFKWSGAFNLYKPGRDIR